MTTDPSSAAAVETYLARLREAAADLPADTRAELVDDIETHLVETVPPGSDEAATRQALDDLGTPEAVAAAARGPVAAPAAPTAGAVESGRLYDVLTTVVLTAGMFVVPVVGWIAGVIMLWAGPRWTREEKVAGTLIWPIGALAGYLVVVVPAAGVSRSAWTILSLGVIVVLVIAAHGYLLRQARRRA